MRFAQHFNFVNYRFLKKKNSLDFIIFHQSVTMVCKVIILDEIEVSRNENVFTAKKNKIR